eukprot:comp12786_c0_seq1/m.7923 comp12786_c0_seq1/g.7923  ORF comp12786_c0_seq1/g.7923 comp12786_c0_seq1/m.7923 type:complete len:159 (-) comp12786_c0_seq1:249-725(-)
MALQLFNFFDEEPFFNSWGFNDPFFRGAVERPRRHPGTIRQTSEGQFWSPRCDVRELADKYEIITELPGVAKENIDVQLKDGMLTLKAEMKHEEVKEGEHFHRRERRFGTYQRQFGVPETVKPEDIKARYENGLLVVDLPKPAPVEEAVTAPTKIAIQ